MRVIAGTKVEFRGLDRIPQEGCWSRRSTNRVWETFALLTLFADPAFILKRELMWIPFFGWYLEGGLGSGEPARGTAGAPAQMSRARGESQTRAADPHLSGRHAPPGRCAAGLQVRDRPSLPASRLALPSRRAEFGPVLVAPPILPPARHHRGGNPRSSRPACRGNAFFKQMQERIETASNRLLARGPPELAAELGGRLKRLLRPAEPAAGHLDGVGARRAYPMGEHSAQPRQ